MKKKKDAKVNEKKHCVLTAAQPSPLSAHRGWFGSAFLSGKYVLVRTEKNSCG